MSIERGKGERFLRELDHTLAQLTVPQGYTLSIGGSFAVATHAYGPPSGTRAAEFVAGALGPGHMTGAHPRFW